MRNSWSLSCSASLVRSPCAWRGGACHGSRVMVPSGCEGTLGVGRKAMTNLDSILKSRAITLPTNVHLVKAMVFPVVMYGCESWTVKKADVLSEEGNPAGLSSCSGGLRPLVELCVEPAGLCGRCPGPPRHAHGDLTNLALHERLHEFLIVPREETHTGAAARENP